MLLFARATQYCFCSISMLLTGLFALSLTGLSWQQMEGSGFGWRSAGSALLFLMIGCSIDVGKYLFWLHREKSVYFGSVSISLMIFSLLASCAFFYSAEEDAFHSISSSEEISNRPNHYLTALEKELSKQEEILNLRLSSQYHHQWEKAEENAKKIHDINLKIKELMDAEELQKLENTTKSVEISRFIHFLAGFLHIDPAIIRGVCYFLLSYFLEISSLGAISLCKSLQKNPSITKDINSLSHLENGQNHFSVEKQKKIDTLIDDIIFEKQEPVLRKIKKSYRGLSVNEIRSVLDDLCKARIVSKGNRGSYVLRKNKRINRDKQ